MSLGGVHHIIPSEEIAIHGQHTHRLNFDVSVIFFFFDVLVLHHVRAFF